MKLNLVYLPSGGNQTQNFRNVHWLQLPFCRGLDWSTIIKEVNLYKWPMFYEFSKWYFTKTSTKRRQNKSRQNLFGCTLHNIHTPVIFSKDLTTYIKPCTYDGLLVCLFVCLMVFNATFITISVISWRSVLLVEKTTDLPQVTDKLYHIMLYTSPWSRFELTPSVMIGTDFIGSCKSNYYMITSNDGPRTMVSTTRNTLLLIILSMFCHVILY